jgi:hypothetical protein
LGAYSTSLVIATNAAGSPQSVPLSGSGTAPAVTTTPASLSFGSQLVAAPSAATPVTVTNSGTANLVISNFSITGTNAADFAYTAGTLPLTVTPGNSVTVNVTFTPAAAGSRSAYLNINDNAGGSPQGVALSGTGTVPGISIRPANLSFASQAVGTPSAPTPLTLSNNGTANLVIANLAVTGQNGGDFSYSAGTLPLTIAPGNNTTVNVTFTPAASGSRTAVLDISDNVSGRFPARAVPRPSL